MVEDAVPAPRQFVAHPAYGAPAVPSPGQNKAIVRYLVYGFIAFVVLSVLLTTMFLSLGDRPMTLFEAVLSGSGAAFLFVGMGSAVVGATVYGKSAARSQSRTILIGVTGGGVTVNERPGVVYSLHGATLGTWSESGGTTGTALHLQSGSERFILGGRDHRLAPETRLGAPEIGYGRGMSINAWVSASDFDQLLDASGLRSRLNVQAPLPGAPVRCTLFPNPLLVQTMGPFAIAQKHDLLNTASQARLAVVVGSDAIWLMDPLSNALIGSAWRAQATAAPSTYQPSLLFHGSYRSYSIAPQLVVNLPSLPPLTIACVDGSLGNFSYLHLRQEFSRRFAWRGNVPVVSDPAEYAVSGADWKTLVEAFGLTTQLQERA